MKRDTLLKAVELEQQINKLSHYLSYARKRNKLELLSPGYWIYQEQKITVTNELQDNILLQLENELERLNKELESL